MLFLIILIICFVMQLFLPWWIMTPLAFGAAFWKGRSAKHAFWSGFLAVFTLWVGTALFYSLPNGNLLANRVGDMLGLPETGFNWLIVLLVAGLTGALAGGFCALAGHYFRQAMVIPEKRAGEI